MSEVARIASVADTPEETNRMRLVPCRFGPEWIRSALTAVRRILHDQAAWVGHGNINCSSIVEAHGDEWWRLALRPGRERSVACLYVNVH